MSVSHSIISSFHNYLKHEKRYSNHTIKAYLADLGQLQEFLDTQDDEDLTLVNVNHQILRHWVVSVMSSGSTARTVNRKISALRTYYNFLKKSGIIKVNPTNRLIGPKTSRRLPVYLKESEINDLFSNIEFSDDWIGQRDLLCLLLLYQCGLRRSELINIQVKDVDLSKGLIKVLGKGAKERLIPISSRLVDQIKLYVDLREQSESLAVKGSSWLFVTDKGKKVYPKFIYNRVVYYLSQVSALEKLSPHILRHTFATHLTDHGAEIMAVKDLLGHASLAATQVYTHNSVEKLKKAYKNAHPRS